MNEIFEIINPVDKSSFDIKSDNKHLLVNKVGFHGRKLSGTKIVILGTGEAQGLMSVRKSLYGLYFGQEISISDWGNIPEENIDKINDILKILLNNNIFVIIIGNAIDILPACLDSMTGRDKISASVVSPAVVRSNFTDKLMNNRFQNLFNFNFLAYQTYLSDPAVLDSLSSRYFEALRLGKFREDNRIYEPLLRDSDIFSLDMASVRKPEIADSLYSGLNGLYSEEVCLISRHAGISDNLKIANIFCHDKIEKKSQKNALIAQIIWHIIDGYANRADEKALNNVNGIKKILINLEQPAEQLVFYHSDITNRWWMEIGEKSEGKPFIISCTEDDYRTACRQDVPLRWLWYQQKLAEKN
ncbi:MAG: hypothetical protein LBF59_09370 [Prevotellaceae bacterium]|jgi:hypothetical protein|nr:hypothetical protein [Prevotellaceae bacterium]